jgi:hypothetical protein
MESQLPPRPSRYEVSGAVIEASLWLRIGVFSGASIGIVGLLSLFRGDSGLALALASVIVGSALATLSTRRAFALLDRQSAAEARDDGLTIVRHCVASES